MGGCCWHLLLNPLRTLLPACNKRSADRCFSAAPVLMRLTWIVQVYSVSSSSLTVHKYSRSRFLTLPLISRLNIIFSPHDRCSASRTRTKKKAQAMSHRPNSPVAQVKRANRSRQHLSPMTWTPRVFYCWLLRTGSSSAHASRSRWSLWLRARADSSRKPVCWPFTAWYLSKGAGPENLIDTPSSQRLRSQNKHSFEMDNERLGWCCVFGGHCCPITWL